MNFLKILFEKGALTFEQFEAAVKEKGYQIADLATGNYVSKQKYETLETTNKTLTDSLTARDDDIANLKKQLEDAGTDADKLKTVSAELEKLQNDYKIAEDDHKTELAKAKYGYAVKDFANVQPFNSEAAKRDFIRSMTEADLKMDGDKILGAADFLEQYKTENEDSFTVDESDKPAPKFSDKTKSNPTPPKENPFASHMKFTGVRAKPE